MRFMDKATADGFARWRRICIVALALAVALPTLESAHPDLVLVASAYADDDDDDGGGGRRGGAGSRGGSDRVYNRGGDGSIFRKLFRRQRPPVRRARPARPAPLPVRVPNEIVAFGISAAQRQQIESLGYTIGQEAVLPGLGGAVWRIVMPAGSNADQSLTELRAAAPGASLDFNHYYRPEALDEECQGGHCLAPQLVGWPSSAAPAAVCTGEGLTVGLIDTAINTDHAAFSHGRLEVTRLSEGKLPESGRQHGTAVAALLVGVPDSRTPGLLPRARLIAVDAFHRGGRSDDRADVFDLARALDLLAEARVGVINLSLAGPANVVLERAVRTVAGKGVVLVAAAGNVGPSAAPTYPAGYQEVISVTAVDRRKRVYRRAGQGGHIDLAAPGVDVWAAASVSGARPKTGTSFAAPFVTAAVAVALRSRGPDAAAHLYALAEDLGEPGKDPVYGWGLLNVQSLCSGDGPALDPAVVVD